MAKAAKTAPAEDTPADEAAATPVKSRKKLILLIALPALIVAAGAGWYLTQGDSHDEEKPREAKAAPVLQPKYIALGEKFTVNLQEEEGDRYLQVGITLKVLDPQMEEAVKSAMPEVRSKLLLLLSSKRPSELISLEGKQQLVQAVIAEVDGILGIPPAPAVTPPAEGQPAGPVASKTVGIADVLFTDFIIQ